MREFSLYFFLLTKHLFLLCHRLLCVEWWGEIWSFLRCVRNITKCWKLKRVWKLFVSIVFLKLVLKFHILVDKDVILYVFRCICLNHVSNNLIAPAGHFFLFFDFNYSGQILEITIAAVHKHEPDRQSAHRELPRSISVLNAGFPLRCAIPMRF